MSNCEKKELAIIILDWNGASDTIECLKCLNNKELYDIYLLDNGSERENVKIVSEFLDKNSYDVQIISDIYEATGESFITYIQSPENMGFAKGNNYIAKKIIERYKYILLLNNDTEIPKDTIEHMLSTAKKMDTVALTCDIRLFSDKRTLWNAGGFFTVIGERKYYSQKKIDKLKKKGILYIDAQFITGCALLINSKYVLENGLFTEKFFHGEEDFNFCYNLWKNRKKVGVDLGVKIYHKVGQSLGRVKKERSYGATLVNYTNRVIDFKFLYSKMHWIIWKEMYLGLVFLIRASKEIEKF